MKKELVESISKEVYRRFPDFAGIRPRVQVQKAVEGGPEPASRTYLLTFQTRVTTSQQRSLPRWVRVVANEKGKILKLSTSH